MSKKRNWRGVSDKVAKDKAEIYNSREWKELRIAKLRSTDGLCEECLKKGIVNAANQVHHIHPIEDSHSVQEMRKWAFMWENLQSLCPSCHAAIHKAEGKGTKALTIERAKQRQDRWADSIVNRFTNKVKSEELRVKNPHTVGREPKPGGSF